MQKGGHPDFSGRSPFGLVLRSQLRLQIRLQSAWVTELPEVVYDKVGFVQIVFKPSNEGAPGPIHIVVDALTYASTKKSCQRSEPKARGQTWDQGVLPQDLHLRDDGKCVNCCIAYLANDVDGL